MHSDQAKSYQSYRLLHYPEAVGEGDESTDSRFLLQQISGDQQQTFASIEQVINFLLDQLEVPKKGEANTP